MISIDDFKPLTLEDKPLFDKHYTKHPPVHSDNLFSTMISWNEYAHYHFACTGKHLMVFSRVKNKPQFRPPSGEFSRDIFHQVITLAQQEGGPYPLALIDLTSKDYLAKNFPHLKFMPMREYFEYVYDASKLAELPGGPYSKIRNRLNKFKKEYTYSTQDISKQNMQEIRKFLRRWCLWKDCEGDPLLENEKKAILYSMAHFFDLKLSGIVIRINDEIEAISVYEKMSPDTIVVHYEKGSPDYDGIYKAINQETAERVHSKFRYINRESDMDIPGLRKAKRSYRPHHMVEVFQVAKEYLVV